MNKFVPSQAHRCSAVPGCSNKPAFYSKSQGSSVLFCKIHRVSRFHMHSSDSDLERMFTIPKNATTEEIEEYATITYSIQSRYIQKILEYDEFDLENFKYLLIFMNYFCKEVRLYSYYKKFAHFQTPNLEELRSYSKRTYFFDEAYDMVVLIKNLWMCLLLNLPKDTKPIITSNKSVYSSNEFIQFKGSRTRELFLKYFKLWEIKIPKLEKKK